MVISFIIMVDGEVNVSNKVLTINSVAIKMSFRRLSCSNNRLNYKQTGTKNPPITDISLYIWLQIDNQEHQKNRRAVRRNYLDYISPV